MKVIFLDVDGVLNTGRYRSFLKKTEFMGYNESQFFFDPMALKNLKDLVNENDAKIVISSTWRYGKDNEGDVFWRMLMGNLRQCKLEDKVIGVTPDLREIYNTINCRGHEISKWLAETNENIEGYVIIDDDDNMHPLMNKLAYCNDFYGFDKKVKIIAEKILNNIEIDDSDNPLIQKELF